MRQRILQLQSQQDLSPPSPPVVVASPPPIVVTPPLPPAVFIPPSIPDVQVQSAITPLGPMLESSGTENTFGAPPQNTEEVVARPALGMAIITNQVQLIQK